MSIYLDNIHKRYGDRSVVKGVSIEVEPGQIVGLLGPNGAGKTTSFYITTGLIAPDRGMVFLNGREVTRLPINVRAQLGLGYLTQQASIFRNLSVADNIRLVLQQGNLPRSWQRDRLKFLLNDFGLYAIRHTKGSSISGGERRRTELARALAVGTAGPDFLLLDEPFAGVDPIAVTEIQKIIARLRAQGMGILITDHNVRETLQITDHAYILREGQILAEGPPDQLYDNQEVRKYYLGDEFRR